PIFFMHSVGDSEYEFLVTFVVFVQHPMFDRTWRVRRQEASDHIGSGERCLEVGEVPSNVGLTDITQVADTNRHRRRTALSVTRIGCEIAAEFPLVARGDAEAP